MRLWDWLCLASIIGIWPRWVEPNLLVRRRYSLPFPLSKPLKIAHLSDLHFANCSRSHLDQIVSAVGRMEPDLILFTGDFLCFAQLIDKEAMRQFLCRFSAPLGCFASLGNHDYARYAVRSDEGRFEIDLPRKGAVGQALKLLRTTAPKGEVEFSDAVAQTPIHPGLEKLLADSPFRLLHNETVQLPIGLNLVGLGDLWMGRMLPEIAFDTYDPDLEGIVLSHNPDSFDQLRPYPGRLILSGHTHGAQINLPWIGPRLAALSDKQYRRGWIENRLYISSGMGAAEPFRLFSLPEVALITLMPEEKVA